MRAIRRLSPRCCFLGSVLVESVNTGRVKKTARRWVIFAWALTVKVSRLFGVFVVFILDSLGSTFLWVPEDAIFSHFPSASSIVASLRKLREDTIGDGAVSPPGSSAGSLSSFHGVEQFATGLTLRYWASGETLCRIVVAWFRRHLRRSRTQALS